MLNLRTEKLLTISELYLAFIFVNIKQLLFVSQVAPTFTKPVSKHSKGYPIYRFTALVGMATW